MEGCTLGQVLHGSATTTKAIRRAIQGSQESLRALAKRHGINPKTVAKWRKRSSVADLPTGPKQPSSTVLSIEEEAIVVAFRRHTVLPLDDCLYALQPTIPHLTRSSLHRCLKRHGISRLPQVEDEVSPKRKFKAYPIGYFHIDIAELRTAEGKLYLFVAIDRTSKFAFVALHEKADRPTAVRFLEALIAAVPYRLHTVLTDNGIQFADLPKNRDGWTARYRVHRFDQICRAHSIEHRLTKPSHPWTNGQVERMNRTLKEATVNCYHYDSHEQLRSHLADFVTAYNYARRLKILKGLSPYEYICNVWTKEPGRFILDPIQQMPGLNNLATPATNETTHARDPNGNRCLAVETACRPYYAPKMGAPSLPPGRYFRMHMVGYFEGIASERGIAWRCSDSISLRDFLGLENREKVPDHSWLSKTRGRLPHEVHETVFSWVLKLLAERGLVKGKRIGVDASTMEANAALRSIVRREDGRSYREMLMQMAKESGIETPSADDLTRIDRNRKGKKLSNTEWTSRTDPEAKIAKLKDGRTHLAYKPEPAVDLDTGVIVAATLQPADAGDTTTIADTRSAAENNLAQVNAAPTPAKPSVGYRQRLLLARRLEGPRRRGVEDAYCRTQAAGLCPWSRRRPRPSGVLCKPHPPGLGDWQAGNAAAGGNRRAIIRP